MLNISINPKIDYVLLGRAVSYYQDNGYTYVEVPWAVEDKHIAATCPTRNRSLLVEEWHEYKSGVNLTHTKTLPLVGSAEQGFISLDLAPGKYVGVTPCFRIEQAYDIFYQPYFVKVELYDNNRYPSNMAADKALVSMMGDARSFMDDNSLRRTAHVRTAIGLDLTIGGVEVGSYGHRVIESHEPYIYGTGLALPRYSVAKAIAAL